MYWISGGGFVVCFVFAALITAIELWAIMVVRLNCFPV
jgi:hypothetical protein